MQKLPLTSFFLLLALLFAPLAVAEDQVTENLKERLKTAVEGADVSDLKLSSTLKGYVGTVSDIIQNTIILEDKEGKKSIKIDDNSTIVRTPGNKEIDLESVRIEDSIIAIGEVVGDDELLGKRLIVSASPLSPPQKLSGFGTIAKIDKYSFSLTSQNSEDPFELFFTGKTVYKTSLGLLTLSDLSVGDEILYTAVKDKDDDWSATIVMQINSAPTPPPAD